MARRPIEPRPPVQPYNYGWDDDNTDEYDDAMADYERDMEDYQKELAEWQIEQAKFDNPVVMDPYVFGEDKLPSFSNDSFGLGLIGFDNDWNHEFDRGGGSSAPDLTIPVNNDPNVIGGAPDTPQTPVEQVDTRYLELEQAVKPALGQGVAIGIPGVIGLGAGGVVMGGLLGGGSSGGGGGSSGGSSGGTADPNTGGVIVPPITGGGGNPEKNPDPVIIPPVAGGGNPEATDPVIVPPPGVVDPDPANPDPIDLEPQDPVIVPPPVIKPPKVTPTPTTNPPKTKPSASTPPIIPLPVTNMPTPTLPTDRNYYREGNQTTQDMSQLGGGIFSNYAGNAGLYGQQDLQNYAGLLGQIGTTNQQLTDIANQQTIAANSALRQGNLSDVQGLSGGYGDAQRQANPELYAQMAQYDQAAGAGMQPNQYQNQLSGLFTQAQGDRMGQAGPLSQALEQSALQQLQLGSGLSDDQRREAEQGIREAYAARGLVYSPGAIGMELLAKDQYGQQLLNQRQGFATGVNQQMMGQQALGLQGQAQTFGMGSDLATMDYARQQQGLGNQQQGIQNRMASYFDPTGTILSQQTGNQGMNQNLFQQGAGFSSGSLSNQYTQGLFDPFNNYARDVYDTNYNAAQGRYISGLNASAAVQAGNAGLIGGLGGAVIGNWGEIGDWLGDLFG